MAAMLSRRPIWRAAWTSLRASLVLGGLLLIPAGLVPGGTWVWPGALVLIAVQGAVKTAGDLALALWRPAHFQVRQQAIVAAADKRQPLVDAVGAAITLCLGALWLATLSADVFWLHLLPSPPAWVRYAGGLAVIVGTALTPLAVWENRFATPNVQEQAGQTVVRSGVYRLVRHPLYLGNLLLTAGTALWLGSTAGLWGFAMLLVATIGRIWIEEKALKASLPDYAAYARQVRARLIPFVI